jgi:hypothetical protein
VTPEPADAAPTTFGTYRKKPIVEVDGKFTNLGDGLSKSKHIEGGLDELGELVTFVIRTRVGKHSYELTEDGKAYRLTGTYIGGTVARIDDDLVAGALNTMEARIQEEADRLSGENTLPGMDQATGRKGARLKAVEDPEAAAE